MGLVVAVLLLAGCTGQEEPAPEPSNGPDGQVTTPAGDGQGPSGPSTEPQGEPQEDYPAPERPEAMENNDIDGAEAAGIYFLELFYYALATGDLQIWEEMSGETCGFCATTHENITEVYDAGGYFETSPPDIYPDRTQIYPNDGGDYVAELSVQTPATRQYDHAGSVERDDPGIATNSVVLLSHTGTEWMVASLQNETVE